MKTHFLYPSHPLRRNQPDEQFEKEYKTLTGLGFLTFLFSFEDLLDGSFRTNAPLPATTIVYRGWMLPPPSYQTLLAGISTTGARPLSSLDAYLSTHYLPQWYPLLGDLTAETKIFPADCDLGAELTALAWPAYFIKDYVKSIKTSVGSLVINPDQAATLAQEMRRFRGSIEGGFCVRRAESYVSGSERRYFVWNSTPYAPNNEVPEIVKKCARRIASPFFSVDVAERDDGALRVIEVGDGQVSDLVGWPVGSFIRLFAQ